MMPRSAYKKTIWFSASFLLLFLLAVPILIIAAREKGDSLNAEEADRAKRVNIRINEEGISIETDDDDRSSGRKGRGATITIETSDRKYKDKTNDIIRFGEDVFIGENEVVMGDLVVFGGDVTIKGRVNGDVFVMGGDIKTFPGAEINGDAIVMGGRLEENENVTIHGERFVMRSFVPVLGFGNFFRPQLNVIKLILFPIKLIFGLLLSFLVVLFMRERVERSRSYLKLEYLKSFGWGLLVCFAAVFILPIATIILAITIIGIPLALLIILSWIGISVIAFTVFIYDLGLRISDKLNLNVENPYALVFIGFASLFLVLFIGLGIGLLPLMGTVGFAIVILAQIFVLFACVTGLGALFSSRFGSRTTAAAPEVPPPGVGG